MDRVRFGRALGVGARQAAKTLMSAAEAAAAPNPNAQARPMGEPNATSRTAPRAVPEVKAVKAQAKTFGKTVWGPFAKFSSVLWLEVTGTFFAVFAAMAGSGAWRWRGAVHLPASSADARRFYVYALVFAVFGYFAVSSFVRAKRRERR